MASLERRPSAPTSPDASGRSSLEKSTQPTLVWKVPGSHMITEQKKFFKERGIDREPRLIFTSTEPIEAYKYRRNLLIGAMLKLAIPSSDFDDRGYPRVYYHTTDILTLPVGIAEFPIAPHEESYPLKSRFIVFKNGLGPEEDFDAYFNLMLDNANTTLTKERRIPFPKK